MKKFSSIAFLLSAITGISMLLLVSVFSLSARDAYENRKIAAERLADIAGVQDLLTAQDLLRLNQGKVSTALGESPASDPDALRHILAVRPRLQAVLGAVMLTARQHSELAPILPTFMAAKSDYDRTSAEILLVLHHASGKSRAALDKQSTRATGALVDVLEKQSIILSNNLDTIDSFMSEMMKVDRIAWRIREDAGTGRHEVVDLLAAGTRPTAQQLARISEIDGRISAPWGAITDDLALPVMPEAIKIAMARANKAYLVHFRATREKRLAQLARGESLRISPQQWLAESDADFASIVTVASTALELSGTHIAAQSDAANRKLYWALGLVALSLVLAALTIIVVVFRIIRPLRRIVQTMKIVVKGDLKHGIPFNDRQDEIGEFARALKSFREQAIEHRQMENDLLHNQIAKESAEASNRIKTEFLANMSHELRTPLNAVIGFSDMMRQKIFGPLNPQYEDYAVMIHESGQLLLNLVSDILDIAKIEAGKFTLDLQKVDLAESVESCLRLVKKRADDRHVALVPKLPATPLQFVADPRGLKQILLNLLSNAVKFTQEGGRIEVIGEVVGEMLQLTVRDNGIGIPAEALKRIGHAFEQASNDPTRAREGTGLGLALVRALAAQHGGSLTIDSAEYVGTTVTVLLPLSQEARKAA